MNQNHAPAVDSTDADQSPNTAHFNIAMRNFNGLLRTNSLAQALVWARQGTLLAGASNDEELVKTANEAYLALILVSAAKFEAQTLHCGNITSVHAVLADIIAESVNCLVACYTTGKQAPQLQMLAVALQGYSNIMRGRVLAVSDNDLPTNIESIAEIFQYLDQISDIAGGLTSNWKLYEMSLEERIVASAEALSNSGYEINWLLPSDYPRAVFYVARAMQLLTIGPKPDRPGMVPSTQPTALLPVLQPVLDAMPKLLVSLTNKEYRDSKRRIKEINAIFETLNAS